MVLQQRLSRKANVEILRARKEVSSIDVITSQDKWLGVALLKSGHKGEYESLIYIYLKKKQCLCVALNELLAVHR